MVWRRHNGSEQLGFIKQQHPIVSHRRTQRFRRRRETGTHNPPPGVQERTEQESIQQAIASGPARGQVKGDEGTWQCGVTYQERQADFTGGAANFFLVTPLGAAADTMDATCSVMTD